MSTVSVKTAHEFKVADALYRRRRIVNTVSLLLACAASLFGKPAKFRRVIRRAGVEPSQVIAIGDEARDIEAARAVGVACGAVCWGYAAPAALRALGPDHVFERMDEIAWTLCPVQ